MWNVWWVVCKLFYHLLHFLRSINLWQWLQTRCQRLPDKGIVHSHWLLLFYSIFSSNFELKLIVLIKWEKRALLLLYIEYKLFCIRESPWFFVRHKGHGHGNLWCVASMTTFESHCHSFAIVLLTQADLHYWWCLRWEGWIHSPHQSTLSTLIWTRTNLNLKGFNLLWPIPIYKQSLKLSTENIVLENDYQFINLFNNKYRI